MINPLKRIAGLISRMGISMRITIFYSLLLLTTLSLSGIFYQRIYAEIMLRKVSSVSMQTLHSVSSNIRSLLESTNNYSKMILSNPSVQKALQSSLDYVDLENQRQVVEFMKAMMSSTPEISSLYIVDNQGNRMFLDKFPNHFQNFNIDRNSSWWKKAESMKGGSFVVLNGGDAFSHNSTQKFISFIRIINDLETQKPIGAVLMNVSERIFIKAYSEIAKNYETGIIILDENNETVISSNPAIEEQVRQYDWRHKGNDFTPEPVKIGNLLYSTVIMEDYNWRVISTIPFGEVKRESRIFMMVTSGIVAIIALLVLVGSIIIAGMISKPVNILVDAMKNISSGSLDKVDFHTSINEYARLRDGYNFMTEEIQTLVRKVVHEEKTKRKAEMNILQAQIKPHFLYNTFDSISSLALMGRNEDVYRIMCALGSFYRIGLSSGKEIITLEEEVNTVRNYLEIQNMRYPDIFNVKYDLDQSLSSVPVVKLILQPFVENCIYHGLKPKNEEGLIEIKTWREGQNVNIMIADDGVGMTEEQVREKECLKGFGIKGTVERLRIYYGIDEPVSIRSDKGKGSQIIITIPEGGPLS